ncbi:MAG: hypothetical protein HZB16_06180 [Armatimonadetes bacterium]|nr:hypothetical protein [Armatimonadota bacterium]
MAAAIVASTGAGAVSRPWQSFYYGGDCYAAVGQGDEAWIGTGAGLRTYSPNGDGVKITELTIEDDLPGPIITAAAFGSKCLWAGAAGGTVGRYDLETATWTHYGQAAKFPAYDPTRLIWDGTDVWAATLGGGVARFSPMRQEWRSWSEADGLPSARVLCLAADSQAVWAGTERGLAKFDRQTESWGPIQSATERSEVLVDAVSDVALSARHVWLAGGGNGLARIDRASGQLATYPSLGRQYGMTRVDRLLLTADGSLWVAGDSGLLRAETEGGGKWTFFRRGPWTVTGLTSAGGSLWAATAHDGVQEYRALNDTWQVYQPREALPSGDVTALAAGQEAGYVGFREAGLARYNLATERWDRLAPRDGKPTHIRDLAVRDRYVYLAGADGLAMYDTREDVWSTAFAQDNEQLRGDDWTGVAATERGVWFVGPKRVVHTSPQLDVRWAVQIADDASLDERTWPRLVPDTTNGDMWIVTAHGAVRHDRQSNHMQAMGGDWLLPRDATKAEREGRLIRDLAVDVECAWFVTLDSVCQFRKQDSSLSVWNTDNVRDLGEPRRVSVGPTAVWVAADAALCRFDRRSATWDTLRWPEELQDEPCTALATDPFEPYYVWMASSRHIARLELREAEPVWRVYPRRTGLVPGVREIVPTRTAVWFSGRGGVSVYRRTAENPTPR